MRLDTEGRLGALFKAAMVAASQRVSDGNPLHAGGAACAMAALFRLIVGAVLSLSAVAAFAVVPQVYQWGGYFGWMGASKYGSSAQAVCDALLPDFISQYGTSYGFSGHRTSLDDSNSSTATCGGYATRDGSESRYAGASISRSNTLICPANSTLVNGSCQCNASYVEGSGATAGTCVVAPSQGDKWKQWCQAANGQQLGFVEVKGRSVSAGCQNLTLAGSPISTPGYSSGDVPTNAGCSISIKNAKSFPDSDGSWYTQGDATVTGGTCREGEPLGTDPAGTEKKPEVAPPPCVGGYPGSVNGTTVCVKPDATNGVDWNGTQRVTNPDGSSTVTNTQTTCKGNTCTTQATVTTMNAGGTPTGTSTTGTTETLGSLCSREKGNGVCSGGGTGSGDESSFKGSCVTGFVAKSDDAVLNAMALEQHKRNCELLRTDTEPSQWAQQEGQRTDDRTESNPKNLNVTVSASDIDTSNALGVAASCPANRFVQIGGQSVGLPFSKVCGALEMLGTVLLGFAFLMGGRIVMRG